MLPAVRTAVVVGGMAFEPEAKLLFGRLPEMPPSPRRRQQNRLFKGLKSSGILPRLDVLDVFAGLTGQTLYNWVQALYDPTVSDAPVVIEDRGILTDGVDDFIDSNFNPATATTPKYVQDSASFGFWQTIIGTSTTSLGGWSDGTDGTTILPRNTSSLPGFRINQAASLAGGSNSDGTGLVVADRPDASNNALYIRGVSFVTGTNASTAVNSATFTWGHATASTYGVGNFLVGLIGQSLSAEQHWTLRGLLGSYLRAIGAIYKVV